MKIAAPPRNEELGSPLIYVKICLCHEEELQAFLKMLMIRNQPITFQNSRIFRELTEQSYVNRMVIKVNTS